MRPEEMEAGRALDVLIAEKVMKQDPCDNWKPFRSGGLSGPEWINDICENHSCYPRSHPCAYSTNIGAAWGVVERLLKTGWDIAINSLTYNERAPWTANVTKRGSFDEWITLEGDTVPLAVCRAALKAVNGVSE